MGGLAIGEVVDDLAEIGETLVDHVGFFQQLALRTRLVNSFTARQIYQIQLSALRRERSQVGLLNLDDEAGVGAGGAGVHVGGTDGAVFTSADH